MSAAALRPRAGPQGLQPLLAGGLALLMALCTTWATIAAGWNAGMSVALATTTVAVVEAVLLASSTAGRVTAAAAAPLLGLLVIVPVTIGGLPAVQPGEDGGLRHVVREYASAFATGLLGDSGWHFIVGFCGGMWLCGFFAGWTAVREHRGFFAALPLYGVLASNAINAPILGAVALPSLLAMGASLLLLTRTTLASLEVRWRSERVVALPGTRRRYGRVAAAAAVAITLLAALAPPLTSTDISGRIFHFNPTNLGRGSGGSGGGNGPGGGAQAVIRFSPNTEPGGALTENPVPVLTYTVDTGDSVYLRVIADTVFLRGNWYPSDRDRPLTSVPVATGQIPRDRVAADGGVTAVSRSVRAHIVFSSSVTSVGDLAQVPFPGEPDSVDRSVTAHGDANPAGELLTVDHVDLPPGVGTQATLNVVGNVPAATEGQLRAAGTAYPAWVRDRGYLALDAATDSDRRQLQDIATLARTWTAGLGSAYDQARAVESHLRTSPFVYTLTPPAPGQGEWPIHAFLLGSHRGYCQYFASSMGTMLRALGIPTRLVTGYGPGSIDDQDPTARVHTVSTSDAHVWVEAYFPGFGWIPFEPTPSSQDGDYQPIPRPVPAGATPSPSAEAAVPTPGPQATSTPRPQGGAGPTDQATTGGPPPLLLATVGGLLGVALLVVLALTWFLRPRTLRGLWTRMRLVGMLLGTGRRPAETLGGYCRRLAASLPPDSVSLVHRAGGPVSRGGEWRQRATDELQVIGDMSGKAAFSRSGLTPAEVIRWRRAWSALVRLLPPLTWRRLIRVDPAARRAAAGSPGDAAS